MTSGVYPNPRHLDSDLRPFVRLFRDDRKPYVTVNKAIFCVLIVDVIRFRCIGRSRAACKERRRYAD